MPRVHTVKKARKNYPNEGIQKGDTYYWWEFRYGGLHRSKTYPKPAQLTQSPFLQEYYSIQEDLEGLSADSAEDLKTQVEEIVSRLENLRDEAQGSLDNMPEGLQQGDTGQLLQERVDGLDGWASDLEGVDLDFEFDEEEPEQEEGESEDEFQTRLEEWQTKKDEAEQDFIQEKLDEIQGSDPGLN